jgi:predicted phage terminase large subunit-like protein
VQNWDPAVVDTETAAFSVCTTWGILGRKLYLVDVLRKRLEFHKIEPAIMHMKGKVQRRLGRTRNSRRRRVDRQCAPEARRRAALAVPLRPNARQVERAIAQTPKIERKRVFLPVNPPWLETFEAEVASFPMSKYFDQVDSMVQFLYLPDYRNRWTIELSAVREHWEQPF